MKQYELYTDGAYQPDVEIAGIGGYLLDPLGNSIFEFSKPITDKNLFRYHESIALIYGLKKALEHGVEDLLCYSDDISFRNIFNSNELSENGIKSNPFRQEIFELKNQFKNILFNHLPRNLNKRADKLAGKILRIYKEDTLPNRMRENFIGQEDKYLNVPGLVCDEDFLDSIKLPFESNIKSFDEFLLTQNNIRHYFLFEAQKLGETVDNIDDNNPISIKIYFIEKNNDGQLVNVKIVASQDIIQKKLTSIGLELLADCFNSYSSYIDEPGNKIGLMFYAPLQPLQKVDMLLRRRGILPIPNTPLTRKFISSTKQFNEIILHNNKELINQSLDLLRSSKLENSLIKIKP